MTTSTAMQLGMIGLGRMGANLVRRLMRDGHSCVAYDVNEAPIAQLESEGATGARTLEEFVGQRKVSYSLLKNSPPGKLGSPRTG